MSLNSHYCYKYGTCKPDALSHLLRASNRDKTVTARHRETSDREDGLSESLLVMRGIVIEPRQYYHRLKPAYLHLVLYGKKVL
ncbi:MAG: hypothetical protein GY777_10120 [Candidatus Brocadiaceae bacterium]|nr:hypothetical protein [Candidatus Brocadiaceae bacterium]